MPLPASPVFPAAPSGADCARLTAEAVAVLQTEREGLAALQQALGDHNGLGGAFAQAVLLISALSGRLVVTGIGKSGHIARKIQATLASTGTPALFVHPAEASHGDLGMVQKGDAVLAFSNSGETTELGDIAAHSRRAGLPLLAVTSRADSTLASAADIPLTLPAMKEACPMGLAPTTSTTMQLAFGDALAVALLQQKGFTASDFGTYHPGGRLGMRLRTVRDIMQTGSAMPLGQPDTPMRDVIMEMTHKALGCIGILDHNGKLVGLITDGDLRRALDLNLATTRAKDIMNPHPLTIGPDVFASDAVRIMNERKRPVTSLFVLDSEQKPLGVVHMHDLLRAGVG